MNGMLMMLKSFGLNPEELIAQAENVRQLAQTAVESLNRIEAKQDEILTLLKSNANTVIEEPNEQAPNSSN